MTIAAFRPTQRPPSALEVIRSADRADAESSANPESAAAPQVLQAQPLGFSPEQLAALAAPLDRAKVRQREQGRSRVSYLEGLQVIAEANRIFGFDGWQRQTIAVRCVAQAERTIGRDQNPGWGVTYTARVRITVTAGGMTPLVREGADDLWQSVWSGALRQAAEGGHQFSHCGPQRQQQKQARRSGAWAPVPITCAARERSKP